MQPIIPFGKLLEQIREKNEPERRALYAPIPGDPPYPHDDPRKPQRPIREDDEVQRGVAIIDFTV
tara:strand:- start:523 stop:717 length:195 start_codon:yes stop_codon:yes gene_type:complete